MGGCRREALRRLDPHPGVKQLAPGGVQLRAGHPQRRRPGQGRASDRRGAGLRRGGRDLLPAPRGADADRQPRARAARAPRRRRRSGAGRHGEAGTNGTCSAPHGVAPAGWPHTRPDGTRGLRGRQRVHPRGKDGAGHLRGPRRATRPPPDRAVVHRSTEPRSVCRHCEAGGSWHAAALRSPRTSSCGPSR